MDDSQMKKDMRKFGEMALGAVTLVLLSSVAVGVFVFASGMV